MITVSESAKIPAADGTWLATAFRESNQVGDAHLAMVAGKVKGRADVLVRVQSECVTGEVFGSRKCDCGPQLQLAMRKIRKQGNGAVLYLRQEGRNIGLFNKIRAYHLQDGGLDTVEANRTLGLPVDARTYEAAADMLRKLGVRSIRLLTNDPHKVAELEKEGIVVSARVPLRTRVTAQDRGYLKTKREKLGHQL